MSHGSKPPHHGSARTTRAVRKAIQESPDSARLLAARYGINPKTVRKWRHRANVDDAPMGPAARLLTAEERAIIVGFRRHTLLPLDDCLHALQATIPQLTRTSLYRCLERYGISHIPGAREERRARLSAKSAPLGFFRIDLTPVATAERRLALFLAADRNCKLLYSGVFDTADRKTATQFLEALLAAVPYRIHTVLTNNGPLFTHPAQSERSDARRHPFDVLCARQGIVHLMTEPNHPWTPDQVAKMSQASKYGTAGYYQFKTRRAAVERAVTFRTAYNFGKRLKSLRGLTPYTYVCRIWEKHPEFFWVNPLKHNWT